MRTRARVRDGERYEENSVHIIPFDALCIRAGPFVCGSK